MWKVELDRDGVIRVREFRTRLGACVVFNRLVRGALGDAWENVSMYPAGSMSDNTGLEPVKSF